MKARDWLKKHGFSLQMKKGLSILVAPENRQVLAGRKSEKINY
jgi:hypothetical protein